MSANASRCFVPIAQRCSNLWISTSVQERISCVFGRLMPSDGSWLSHPTSIACRINEKEFDLRMVKLLVIDPVTGYLGTNGRGVSRNYAAHVRTILNRLDMFAARHDLGVLALSHLNKATGARSITRISGSQEWANAPRAILLVTEEAGTRRRLLVPLKSNIGPDNACELLRRIKYEALREYRNKIGRGDRRP
jgi:hypothetical protein